MNVFALLLLGRDETEMDRHGDGGRQTVSTLIRARKREGVSEREMEREQERKRKRGGTGDRWRSNERLQALLRVKQQH